MNKLITILALLSTSVSAAITKKTTKDAFANTYTVSCTSEFDLDKEIVGFTIEKHFKDAKPMFTRLVNFSITEGSSSYTTTQEKIGQTLTKLNNVSRDSTYSSGQWINLVITKLSDSDVKRWLKHKDSDITIRISTSKGGNATEQLPTGMLNCLRGL